MFRRSSRYLALGGLVVVAFGAGARSAPDGGALLARAGSELRFSPQGRGSRPPAPSEPTTAEELPTVSDSALVYEGDGGQAGSANGFIAVTGSYGVGTSVLYVLDTVNKQLAVYEARGGSPASRRLVLVGARRIDLDLQLEGYNDDSEYKYRELREEFDKRSRSPGAADASDAQSPAGAPAAKTGEEPGKTSRGS